MTRDFIILEVKGYKNTFSLTVNCKVIDTPIQSSILKLCFYKA